MSGEFRIQEEGHANATPEQVWDAVTVNAGGWLWPMDFEPRAGGSAPFGGTVTVWEPPRRLTTRVERPDGWFNELDFVIEPREGGAYVRYVHSGIFEDDWDNQYDGARKHTAFYQHTLRQYVEHFAGRAAIFVDVRAADDTVTPDAFDRLKAALAHGDGRVDLPGIGPRDVVVDYDNENFLGLRAEDAMFRFFGRNAWGDPVGLTVHIFDTSVDAAAVEKALTNWLNSIYS